MTSPISGFTSFSPRFVRAKLTFTVGNTVYDAGEHLINAFGVPSFVLGPSHSELNPLSMIGNQTRVEVRVLSQAPFTFACEGHFTCDQTESGVMLGISFTLSDREKTTLNTILKNEGIFPEFVRRYPRILFNRKAAVMPSRSMLQFIDREGEHLMIICDVRNLSPTGFQICTEDKRAARLGPTEVVRVQLQPRGDFLYPISLSASVKQVIHSVQPESGNRIWDFGLSIRMLQRKDKALFTELLRQVIDQLRG